MFNPEPESIVIDITSFAATPSLPPQNIEAEEAILGGILIDPEAIGRVAETLNPEVFYVSSHKAIYRAMLDLHVKDSPTDLRFVADWLAGHSQLDKVGGKAKLVQLADRTVTAVNIDALAELITDKWTRRRLITAASQLEKLAHDGIKSIEEILDEAEQVIYKIANDSKLACANQVEVIGSICPRVYTRIEEGELSGVKTNGAFLDLDKITGGFHAGELAIAAARPSIGKTQLVVHQANLAGLDRRIQSFQFMPCICSFKAPVYSCPFLITLSLPSENFRFQHFCFWNSSL